MKILYKILITIEAVSGCWSSVIRNKKAAPFEGGRSLLTHYFN